MYEDQVLNYLMNINNKLGSVDNNVLNTKVSNDRILYQLQELNSGDRIQTQAISDSSYNTSVYLGCANLILMVTLLISLLPHRKGVLKKHD